MNLLRIAPRFVALLLLAFGSVSAGDYADVHSTGTATTLPVTFSPTATVADDPEVHAPPAADLAAPVTAFANAYPGAFNRTGNAAVPTRIAPERSNEIQIDGHTKAVARTEDDHREVEIPDPLLRRALRAVFEKQEAEPITRAELASLDALTVRIGIVELTGLEHAVNLTKLWLGSNRIADLSPLSNLVALEVLELRNNALSDIRPLAGLTNLKMLWLQYNSISDIAPLAGMTKLEELYIGNNSISELSPLAEMDKLVVLSAFSNSIAGVGALRGKPSLKELFLQSNMISDVRALQELYELELLHLNRNAVSDLSPLAGLDKLQYLYLSHNRVTDIAPLAHFNQLRELNLDTNGVRDVSPLASLDQLRFVDLQFNRIGELPEFSPMLHAVGLRFENNFITDISPLANWPNLAILSFAFNLVSDISALEFIDGGNLAFVRLNNNRVADLSPLVRNPHFQGSPFDGPVVDARHNPLSDVSLDKHIPDLRSRWVAVIDFDDHGDVPGDATGVEIGSVTRGETSPNYEIDFFRFELSEETDIEIFSTGGTSPNPLTEEGFKNEYHLRYPGANKVGRLYDDSGHLIEFDGGTGPDFEMRLTLDPGIYHLSVVSYGDGRRNYLVNLVDAAETIAAVSIPDYHLRQAVARELGKDPDDKISSIEMAKLTILDAPASAIVDLAGLEFATNLFAVFLDNNLITDIAPLEGAVHMQQLQLQENEISDFSALADLKSLFILLLDSNSITDLRPLAGLNEMKFLFLQSNEIVDISPLADMTRLVELRLGSNSIADLAPLAKMLRLSRLYIQSNRIVELGPLAGLDNLRWLIASDNLITDVSPLATMQSLHRLFLGYNRIADISPLADMLKLNLLHLQSNRITDISPILTMSGLSDLNLQYNRITDFSPLQVHRDVWPYSSFDRFNLRGNPLDEASIEYLQSPHEIGTVYFAPDDHGDARGDATALRLGQRALGSISPRDIDYFQLDLERRSDVHLTLSAFGTVGTYVQGRFTDAANNELATIRDYPREPLRFVGRLEPGTYFVEVFNERSFDKKEYALDVVEFHRNKTFVPLFFSQANPQRQSFVRLINHGANSGWLEIDRTDDAGQAYEDVALRVEPDNAIHFNSRDIEEGNPSKAIYVGTGATNGNLRLGFNSILDIEMLAYSRTTDGFLATLHDTAPKRDASYWVALFNPGSEVDQNSSLHLVNAGDRAAEVTVEGIDDGGNASSGTMELRLPPNSVRTLSARELEFGSLGTEGSLGTGIGKWQLYLQSSEPIHVIGFLENSDGALANLSAAPALPADGIHRVLMFPSAADALGRQGYLRIVNRSMLKGEVTIQAHDATDWSYPPLTLPVGPRESKHISSVDLEHGNEGKELSGGLGPGVGDWWLSVESNLDIDVLAYIRHADGLLTAMHNSESKPGNHHAVPMFNPGSNVRQVSSLRLINSGLDTANVTIAGFDDRGNPSEGEVELRLPGGAVRTIRADELEQGGPELQGALGDGRGKWRLTATADSPIWLLSLLESPTGHLSNLSGTRRQQFEAVH